MSLPISAVPEETKDFVCVSVSPSLRLAGSAPWQRSPLGRLSRVALPVHPILTAMWGLLLLSVRTNYRLPLRIHLGLAKEASGKLGLLKATEKKRGGRKRIFELDTGKE